MDNKDKREITTEEMEQSFKDMVFDVFASRMPGVHLDEDGLIVVPIPIRNKKPESPSNDTRQG